MNKIDSVVDRSDGIQINLDIIPNQSLATSADFSLGKSLPTIGG